MSKPETLVEAVAKATSFFGRVDILINNAGMSTCVCVCVCVCVYMYGLHHQDVRHESEADSCHLPHCIVNRRRLRMVTTEHNTFNLFFFHINCCVVKDWNVGVYWCG